MLSYQTPSLKPTQGRGPGNLSSESCRWLSLPSAFPSLQPGLHPLCTRRPAPGGRSPRKRWSSREDDRAQPGSTRGDVSAQAEDPGAVSLRTCPPPPRRAPAPRGGGHCAHGQGHVSLDASRCPLHPGARWAQDGDGQGKTRRVESGRGVVKAPATPQGPHAGWGARRPAAVLAAKATWTEGPGCRRRRDRRGRPGALRTQV